MTNGQNVDSTQGCPLHSKCPKCSQIFVSQYIHHVRNCASIRLCNIYTCYAAQQWTEYNTVHSHIKMSKVLTNICMALYINRKINCYELSHYTLPIFLVILIQVFRMIVAEREWGGLLVWMSFSRGFTNLWSRRQLPDGRRQRMRAERTFGERRRRESIF